MAECDISLIKDQVEGTVIAQGNLYGYRQDGFAGCE